MNWRTTSLATLLTFSFFASIGQNYLMNASTTSIVTCQGFFLDSGGGSNPYGPNQNLRTTICPGSGGTHVQLVFSGTQIMAGDDLCFYDGTSTAAPSLGCAIDFGGSAAFIIQATATNTSGCITVTFRSNASNQGAGWSADINCTAACQLIEAQLDSIYPEPNVPDTGWVDICPGERVFFYGKGAYPQNGAVYNHSDLTSNFEWDFGDGTRTFGNRVSHVFDKPGGYITQLTIRDQFGCKSTNFISQRIRVAPKPTFTIGSYPQQVCVGDTVSLNAIVDSIDNLHTVSVLPANGSFQTQGVRADSLPLPDGDGTSYSTTISFNDFAPGQVLTNVNDLLGIWVNMEHSWMRDLQIRLTCPNGQSAILHNHPGQIGGEVHLGIPNESDEGNMIPIPGVGYNYGWSPAPDFDYTWITYSNTFLPNTLPSGSFRPYQPISNFVGCPLNGDWTIQVTDLWAIDNGYIFSWSVDFSPSLYPSVETFSPALINWEWNNHPSIFYATQDSITGSPINAGEVAYSFTVHDDFGCVWDTILDIQVLPFTHPDCYNCGQILNPVPDAAVCQGDQVSLNASSPVQTSSSVTFESYDNYPIGASNHPPSNPYRSVIQVNSIFPATITNVVNDIVSVCLDLETDFDADIQIFLRSPNNQLLRLSTNNGGSGDNYTQTCFTPTAVIPIIAASPPFTGNFRPQGSFTILNNVPINGNWTLEISDAFGLNSLGKLNWWSITFNARNNVTYTWSPSAGLSCSNCPNPTFIPNSNRELVVTANDSYGCNSKDTVSVTVLNSLTAPAIVCQQINPGELNIEWNDATPGLNYEINVNNTGWQLPNNGNLSHVVAGLLNEDVVNIQVRADMPNANCAVGVGTSTCVYQFCPINASLVSSGPYSVTCAGICDGSVEIAVQNAIMPYSFYVRNLTIGSSSVQNSNTLTGLCGGSYEVIVTDGTNCKDTLYFTINEPPGFTISAAQTNMVSCNGGADACAQVVANGGSGIYTYRWSDSNATTGQNICNLPAGQVSVTVTDADGCQNSASVTILQPPAITLSVLKTDAKCFGESSGTATVNASGGTGSYTFQWDGGTAPNQASNTGLAQGTYNVTVMDANNCQAFTSVNIGQPVSAVSAMASQTLRGCFGLNESQARVDATGGSQPYTYNWTPSGQTSQTAFNLAPNVYSAVVTDSKGCSSSTQITVRDWEPVNVSISHNPPTCNGSSDGEMAANIVTGGNGNYNFQWNNGATTDFISGLSGAKTYTVTVTDTQGCVGYGSKFLVNPAPIVVQTSSTNTLCFAGNGGSATVVNVLNNQGAISYLWSTNANSQTSATATGLRIGTYLVTVTDANGCTGTGSTNVAQPPAITTQFQIVNNRCFGESKGSVNMTISGGTGAYNIAWSNGAFTPSMANLPVGIYRVTITDANSCVRIDSALVYQPAPVTTTFNIKDASCFGEKNGAITVLAQGGSPPFTYSLNGNQYNGSSTLIALAAGTYPVYIKDGKGCIYTTQATVNQPPKMTVDIFGNNENVNELMVNFGDSILLEAVVSNGVGNLTYHWDAYYCGTLFCNRQSDCDQELNCPALLSVPDYTNDYTLLVVDENGCEAEDRFQVHVHKDRRVMVPTGFSPNADGINDLLSVHGKSGTMIKRFQIFDRWGELLFQQYDMPINDETMGWDGNFKNKAMPPGVYIWYLEAEYFDGMKETYKGEVTLIR